MEETMGSTSAIRAVEMNPGTKKLYFVETKKYSKLKPENQKLTASLTLKTGVLSLGVGVVRTLGIAKQFYKLYHDATNKVIGFRIKSKLEGNEMKNGWRAVKLAAAGSLPMSVRPALNQMAGLKPKYKDLKIKRYKDYQSQMDNETYYYVELK